MGLVVLAEYINFNVRFWPHSDTQTLLNNYVKKDNATSKLPRPKK